MYWKKVKNKYTEFLRPNLFLKKRNNMHQKSENQIYRRFARYTKFMHDLNVWVYLLY